MTATTTNEAKLGLVAELGARGVVMDGLDAVSVGEAVATAAPDVIVNEMTAISATHAGPVADAYAVLHEASEARRHHR